jgi:two-component system response regulator FlrC
MTMRRILVVDAEAGRRAAFADALEHGGFAVLSAATAERALESVAAEPVNLVVADLQLPQRSGLELVRALARGARPTPAVVVTPQGTIEDAVAALHLGARDLLVQPFSPADLVRLVQQTLDRPTDADGEHDRPMARPRLVTVDAAMGRLLETVEAIASSRVPVLIEGESGTGKELLARHLHQRGVRRGGPFVTVQCAALPRDLLERELFGCEPGALAGVLTRTLGKIELANGGTLLLDEIGETDLRLQVKLLRVLATHEVERIGAARATPVDVRIVATTTRRLRDLADARRFREDLLERLSAVPLVVPALRARRGDVALLAARYLERLAPLTLDAGARAWLERQPWPGNVRELEHALERAALVARGGVITAADLGDRHAPPRIGFGGLAGLTVREMERRLIFDTLERTRNNRTQAAKLLGISIRTLRNKLAEYRSRGELDLAAGPEN